MSNDNLKFTFAPGTLVDNTPEAEYFAEFRNWWNSPEAVNQRLSVEFQASPTGNGPNERLLMARGNWRGYVTPVADGPVCYPVSQATFVLPHQLEVVTVHNTDTMSDLYQFRIELYGSDSSSAVILTNCFNTGNPAALVTPNNYNAVKAAILSVLPVQFTSNGTLDMVHNAYPFIVDSYGFLNIQLIKPASEAGGTIRLVVIGERSWIPNDPEVVFWDSTVPLNPTGTEQLIYPEGWGMCTP